VNGFHNTSDHLLGGSSGIIARHW